MSATRTMKVTSRTIGTGMSKYYTQGYNVGRASPYSSGETDTLQGNQSCSNYWNHYVNGSGEIESPDGQPPQDYISGWTAGCENAPYGQSGVDVPGSNLGPNNSSEPYPPSEGQ